MDCTWVKEHLYAYLDGELSPQAVADLEAHCNTCASCQAALQQAQAVNDLLLAQARPLVAPPQDFTARVMTAIAAEPAYTTTAQPAQIIPLRSRHPRWGRRVGSVAVAAALFVGVLVADPFRGPAAIPDPDLQVAENTPGSDTQPDTAAPPTQPTTIPETVAPEPGANLKPTTATLAKPSPSEKPSLRQPNTTKKPAAQPVAPTVMTAQTPPTKQPEVVTTTQGTAVAPTPPVTGISNEGSPSAPDSTVVEPTAPSASGSLQLPKAAYGETGNGRFEIRLVAAHPGYNISAPMANEQNGRINYYVTVGEQSQLWQGDIDECTEPEFIAAYPLISTPVVAATTDNVSAFSPDGSLMAALGTANAVPGLWLTGLTDDKAPWCLTDLAGGSILSWAPNSGKLVFTDALNCLYVAYPAENLVLPIATGDVSEVLWVDRGNTLLFAMCPEGETNTGLYVAQLP